MLHLLKHHDMHRYTYTQTSLCDMRRRERRRGLPGEGGESEGGGGEGGGSDRRPAAAKAAEVMVAARANRLDSIVADTPGICSPLSHQQGSIIHRYYDIDLDRKHPSRNERSFVNECYSVTYTIIRTRTQVRVGARHTLTTD